MDFEFENYRILETDMGKFNWDYFKNITNSTVEIVHDYGIQKVCSYFKWLDQDVLVPVLLIHFEKNFCEPDIHPWMLVCLSPPTVGLACNCWYHLQLESPAVERLSACPLLLPLWTVTSLWVVSLGSGLLIHLVGFLFQPCHGKVCLGVCILCNPHLYYNSHFLLWICILLLAPLSLNQTTELVPLHPVAKCNSGHHGVFPGDGQLIHGCQYLCFRFPS